MDRGPPGGPPPPRAGGGAPNRWAARGENRVVELAAGDGVDGGHLGAGVLQASARGRQRFDGVDQVRGIGGGRLGAREHHRDLAPRALDGPCGQFGQGAADHFLVGLGQLPADGGAAVRAEHLDRVGQAVGEPVRRLEEHAGA